MENTAELLTPTKSATETTLTSLQEHAYALLEENKGLILATAMGTAITIPIILRPALAKILQSTFRPERIESSLASKTLDSPRTSLQEPVTSTRHLIDEKGAPFTETTHIDYIHHLPLRTVNATGKARSETALSALLGIGGVDGKIAAYKVPAEPSKNPGIVFHEVDGFWKTPPIEMEKRRLSQLDPKKR